MWALVLLFTGAWAATFNTSGRAIVADGVPQLFRGGGSAARRALAPCSLPCAALPLWTPSLNSRAMFPASDSVAYSPTPIGIEPSGSQSLDFFTAAYAPLYRRDLPMMAAVGVNAVRVYTLDPDEGSHVDFFDECAKHNITVMGGFELDTGHYDLTTSLGQQHAKLELQMQLNELSGGHPAVGIWLVGNELNLPSAGFICDPPPGGNRTCQFAGYQLPTLFGFIDELCEVVHQYGMLCSTALAEYPVPPTWNQTAYDSSEGATRWVYELDPYMPHLDLWTANVYRPGGFTDFFAAYEARSERPLIVSEFGVDAFDSGWGDNDECDNPPCRRMRENAADQAAMLQILVEDLERHTVTCEHNCGGFYGEHPVASGGFVFSWVDEFYKGHGPPSNPANGPPDTPWVYNKDWAPWGWCPDWDPWLQSPCGFSLPNGLDNFWNEEWFGITSTETCDAAGIDVVTPRTAYYTLGALWALGGCTVQSGGSQLDAYSGYPHCASSILSMRNGDVLRLHPPRLKHPTDCDYQFRVYELTGDCPRPPEYFDFGNGVSQTLVSESLRLPAPSTCEPRVTSTQEHLASFQCNRDPGTPRLQRVPETAVLLLDCSPWIMRGISYSPVPFGDDPSYVAPYGDYFTDSYASLFRRDIALFTEMGANTIRLYAWRQSIRHGIFLDEAHANGLVVVSAFEMGTAEDSPVETVQQRNLLRGRLQARLRVSRHPAIVAWLVGNELNGAWNEYTCEDSYATTFLHRPCTFGDSAYKLCALVDSLCEVVHAEGLLCSTPLAGVNPPAKYVYPIDGLWGYSLHGWAQICEGTRHVPGEQYEGVKYVDFWAGNLYPGRDFTAFNFSLYAQSSRLPIMISEFGVDAYNTDCKSADPDVVGCEDESAQAAWLMSLVEDIERHASACVTGCANESGRVVIGGSIMAWVDEMWKGRVIDAVEFDNRSEAMGAMCPDPWANVHTPCGYPSGAQPDTYVNEEWFGILAVEKPCGNGVDRLRARRAWHRLKLLWKDGGCIGHFDPNGPYELLLPWMTNSSNGTVTNGVKVLQYSAPYNSSTHASCGEALSRLRNELAACAPAIALARARNNMSDVPSNCELAVKLNWDGTDCALQAILANTDVCPSLPSHMADINSTIYDAMLAWPPTPETCPDPALFAFQQHISTICLGVVMVLLLVLSNLRYLKWAILRLRFTRRALSRNIFATPKAPISQRNSLLVGTEGRPLNEILAACTMEPEPHPTVIPFDKRAERDLAVRRVLEPIARMCAESFGFQVSQPDSLSKAGSVPSNMDNQIDHLVALLGQRLDRQLEGGQLPGAFFAAFQHAVADLHETLLGRYMLWVEHVALRDKTIVRKTQVTVGSFGFTSPAGFGIDSPGDSMAVCNGCICNLQLHRVVLYMLIWGESANLRHLPECLCLLLYCASNALVVEHPVTSQETGSLPTTYSPGQIARLPIDIASALSRPMFLEALVEPMYRFLAQEISDRHQEDVSKRVMYDDVNEFFWNPSKIRMLVPSIDESGVKGQTATAYTDLRSFFMRAQRNAHRSIPLKQIFKKTYLEKISWAHLIKNYRRIFGMHLVAFHVMLAVAANDGRWDWRYVSTSALTHAQFSVGMQLISAWISPGSSRAVVAHLMYAIPHVALTMLFVLELFVCELSAPWLGVELRATTGLGRNGCFDLFASNEALQTFIYGHASILNATDASASDEPLLARIVGMRSVYEIVAFLYMAVFSVSYVWPSLFRKLFRPLRPKAFLERGVSDLSHVGTRTIYTVLWLVILSAKFSFEYYAVIEPVVEPSRCIWRDARSRFYCWAYDAGGNGCSEFFPNVTLVNPDTMEPEYFPKGRGFGDAFPPWGISDGFSKQADDYLKSVRAFRSFFYAAMILGTRWATPFLLMLADTIYFYTFFASIFSFVIAHSRGIYRTHTWSQLVKDLPMTVRRFNERILAVRPGVSLLPHYPNTLEWYLRDSPEESERVQRFEPSIEGCSTEWRSFARAWNRIVRSLRSSDYLSDSEQAELQFEVLDDELAHRALGSVYVVLPAMCTAPVFTRSFWTNSSTSYPSTLRTMLQARDMAWYLLVQLKLVKSDDDETRRAFLSALTDYGEREEWLRYHRRSGDPGFVPELLAALMKCLLTVSDAVNDKGAAAMAAGKEEQAEGYEAQAPTTSTVTWSPGREKRSRKQVAAAVNDLIQTLVSIEKKEVKQVKSVKRAGSYQHMVNSMKSMKNFAKVDAPDALTSEGGPLAQLKDLLTTNPKILDVQAVAQNPAVLRALIRNLDSANPGGEPRNAEARRQLIFFSNSLNNTQLSQPLPLTHMRSWTAFTPHYAEDVTVSIEALNRANTDNVTLLEILQALHPDEWDNLNERVLGRDGRAEPTEDDCERWASDRSQVLSRTVRGVMRCGEALEDLARLEGLNQADAEALVHSKFEYVLACQIYHRLRQSEDPIDKQKANQIDELRVQYPKGLRVAYVQLPTATAPLSSSGGGMMDEVSAFYSVLIGKSADGKDDRVLYKIRLPGNPILGEGKPENQNHAVVFTRGENLQTLDMNQDNYMGESYKMRNLLGCFEGRVRIVGFREHIFSESGGAVASFAASNEYVFGTMVQRFLTWPLMVRFHYGHPDMWDKVWALTNGGISKASKTLHVSEDIFGGVNAVLRGESIAFVEFIHCGKARDVTFSAANGFEQKISGGNAFQSMSRDFARLAGRYDMFRLLSTYYTGNGQFASSGIMIWALYWFALCTALLALVGLESIMETADGCYVDLMSTGSSQVYASQWFLQLGFLLVLPLFLELAGGMGVILALKEIGWQILTGKLFYTVFQERTRAYYMHNGLTLGSAKYVATGRTLVSMSSNFVLNFSLYTRSHFLFAAELTYIMFVYYLFTSQGGMLALVQTWPVWMLIVSFTISPWLFNPRAFQGLSVFRSLLEFLSWIDPFCDETARGGGWKKWHTEAMRKQRSVLGGRKFFLVLGQKLTPRLCLFTAATAALHIDPIGDGVVLNFAIFRTWIMLASSLTFLFFTLVYIQLAHPAFLQRLFAKNRVVHALYLWGLRVLIVYLFLEVVWLLFAQYMSSLMTVDPVYLYVPYYRNSCAVLVAVTSVHIGIVQVCAFISEKPRYCRPLLKWLREYSDSWYREADMIVGQIIGMVLLALGALPLGFGHSKLLFNQMYAASLERLQKQRELLLLSSGASVSLTDMRTVSNFVTRQAANLFNRCLSFCGWVLSLCGLRVTVTSLVQKCTRCTCWPADEMGRKQASQTRSSRRPTSDAVARLPNILTGYGPQSDAFLSRLMGPKAELEALGLLDEDEGEDESGTRDGAAPSAAAPDAAEGEDALAELSTHSSSDPRAAKRAAKARGRRMSQAVTVTFSALQMEETKEFQQRLEALETQEKEKETQEAVDSDRGVKFTLPAKKSSGNLAGFDLPSMRYQQVDGDEDEGADGQGRPSSTDGRRETLASRKTGSTRSKRLIDTMSKRFHSILPSTREEGVAEAEEELALAENDDDDDDELPAPPTLLPSVTLEGDETYKGLIEQSWRTIPPALRAKTDMDRGMRQAVLRRVIGRIAYDFADFFGFQKEQPLFVNPAAAAAAAPKTAAAAASAPNEEPVRLQEDAAPSPPDKVLSSVANQVDNLVSLISNRMDAHPGKSFIFAMHESIAALHSKIFTNYENWVRRLDLLPHLNQAPQTVMVDGMRCISLGSYQVSLGDFTSVEEGYAWVHNAQLQRLVLFFLMHGEAANLRHLPECLCFIFYNLVHSLALLDTRASRNATGVDFLEAQMVVPQYRPGEPQAFGTDDFLHSIVTPFYKMIESEIAGRAKDPVASRVMYDDITECFWQRAMVDLLLPLVNDRPGCTREQLAYPHLRKLLANPHLAAATLVKQRRLSGDVLAAAKKSGRHPLRVFFGKTYLEKPGWAHCYHVFNRVHMWHFVFFHVGVAGVFNGWTWESLSYACITHAICKILRQLIDMHIGHPPRSTDSKVFGFRTDKKVLGGLFRISTQSYTEHITLILLFMVVPMVPLLEYYFTAPGDIITGKMYRVISIAYVTTFAGSYFVHTKAGHRVRSLWRTKHKHHIGTDEHLSVPLGDFVTYTSFWAAVLTFKFWFDVTFIITPLKYPVQGLLEFHFSRIAWEGCAESLLVPQPGDALHGFCAAYEGILRWTLLLLRFSVPFLVFQFDTYIFFNLGSTVFSSLIALRRKIGVVSDWRNLVIYVTDNVRDFNAKLLGTEAPALPSNRSDSDASSTWCADALTFEWQAYSRAWNAIVTSLRESDYISNDEFDELLFDSIIEEDDVDGQGGFFDVPEYVIFPTFVTSPVLTADAVSLQQGARTLRNLRGNHSYPSFERTLQQTRDLLLWVFVRLGVIPMQTRMMVMSSVSELVALEAKYLLYRHGSEERAKNMRKSVATFLQFLLDGLIDARTQQGESESEASLGPSKFAKDLALQVTHMLRKLKLHFLDAFETRHVASATDKAYRECVDAWEGLQQLVTPSEQAIDHALSHATGRSDVLKVVRVLYRSFFSVNPGGEPRNLEAKRQLLFFSNSLFNTTLSKPPPVGQMKSWSAMTPHYAEDVTYSMKALREEKEGANGSLQMLLTSLFAEEWHNFCERVGILQTSMHVPKEIEPQLQRWASDRAQVLSRTARGMIRYGEALRVQARLEGMPEEDIEMTIATKFEFVMTCQIYGKLKGGAPGSDEAQKAEAIDELRRQHAHNLRLAYVEGDVKKAEEGFFSVLRAIHPVTGEDLVLYKIRLPGNPIVGEGKPENQNHAVVFTRGEHLQTLDMNQDNYMGESYKMRNLLECFRGRVRIVGFREHIFSESGGAVASFAASNEYVFGTMVQRFLTWPLMVRFHYGHPDVWDKVWAFSNGGISKASKTLHVSEDIFAGFNTVLRGGYVEYLEYIHCGKGRDMGFTAVNGFETKISAGNALQCMSRDVYRLGKQFDLARLFSFYFSASGFYITTMYTVQAVLFFTLAQLALALCGAESFEYEYELPGDGRRLQQPLGQPPAGWRPQPLHPHQLALHGDVISMLEGPDSDGSLEASSVSASGSIYSAAYVMQLGFAMLLPYGVELWVEVSLWRAVTKTLRMILSFSFIFSLFTMQTKGFNFSNAITYGRAGYVATGRGFQMDTLQLITLYANYAESHVYLGFEILVYLVFFWMVTETPVDVYMVASFPVLLLIVALMLSPWLFNPGALTFPAMSAAWRDWRLWIDSACDIKAAQSNWRTWHTNRKASARKSFGMGKLIAAVFVVLPRLILILACSAYLRSSRVLVKYDPAWAFSLIFQSSTIMIALSLVHVACQLLLIDRVRLHPSVNVVLTQLNRIAVIVSWLILCTWYWESWCWQQSCSYERAALRSCWYDPLAVTGGVGGFSCEANPTQPRSCERHCMSTIIETRDGVGVSCIDGSQFTACLISGTGNSSVCAGAYRDPIREEYEFCMAEMPSVGVALAGSICAVAMAVQLLGLIDRHGWKDWLAKRQRETLEQHVDSQRIITYMRTSSSMAGRARGFKVQELCDALPMIPYERVKSAVAALAGGRFPRLGPGMRGKENATPTTKLALGYKPVSGPSFGPGRKSNVHDGVLNVLRSNDDEVYRPVPNIAVLNAFDQCWFRFRQGVRASIAHSANGAGIVSDFYYHLFDMIVALSLFVFLTILTLLPLHEAQSVLLFNANFAHVIKRGMRVRDFLDSLWA